MMKKKQSRNTFLKRNNKLGHHQKKPPDLKCHDTGQSPKVAII